MKSILHNKDDRTCFLCKLNGDHSTKNNLQEHHVFYGTANRKKSEQYGLKVYLCLEHHTQGAQSVHHNQNNSEILKMIGQKKFEETHTREEFIREFGRNWL